MAGGVVFAAGVSHVPYMTALPDAPEARVRDCVYDALKMVGDEMRAAAPDLLVIVSADHFINLFTTCMPAFVVGKAARHKGPVEKWIRIEPTTIDGCPAFADALLAGAADQFDLAFSQDMILEHGVMVPLSFIDPRYELPIVPILQNCMVPPMPSLRRCWMLGKLIRSVAERSGRRVAVVGTGGLSHSPGAPEAGFIDEEFDRRFLELLASDTPEDALDIPNERLDRAGFGTWEVRQWATALGAAGGGRARVLVYEAVKEWETGCAAAIFDATEAGVSRRAATPAIPA
jgi:hypothetical protein